jgi:hypothetical protein
MPEPVSWPHKGGCGSRRAHRRGAAERDLLPDTGVAPRAGFYRVPRAIDGQRQRGGGAWPAGPRLRRGRREATPAIGREAVVTQQLRGRTAAPLLASCRPYLSIAPIGLQRRKAHWRLPNTYLATVTISGSVGPVTTCATWAPPNELVGRAHSSDARTRVGAGRRHDRRHLSGASLVTAHTRYLASADGVRVRAERLGALANPVEMVLAGSGHISDGRPAYGGQRKVKL